MSWSDVSEAAYVVAEKQVRGCYQRAFLKGWQALSGSTLKGKAARWGVVYAERRANFLARCRAAGLVVSERRGERGKRILVLRTRLEAEAVTVAWVPELSDVA